MQLFQDRPIWYVNANIVERKPEISFYFYNIEWDWCIRYLLYQMLLHHCITDMNYLMLYIQNIIVYVWFIYVSPLVAAAVIWWCSNGILAFLHLWISEIPWHIEVRTSADTDGTIKWLLKLNGCMWLARAWPEWQEPASPTRLVWFSNISVSQYCVDICLLLTFVETCDVEQVQDLASKMEQDGSRYSWLWCRSADEEMCWKMRLPSVALLGGTYVRNVFFTCYRY